MLVSLRLPGYRCANDTLRRLNGHPESTSISASVPGDARVSALGQRARVIGLSRKQTDPLLTHGRHPPVRTLVQSTPHPIGIHLHKFLTNPQSDRLYGHTLPVNMKKSSIQGV